MVRLTDRPDMTLDVYRGRKTTMQQCNILTPALMTTFNWLNDGTNLHHNAFTQSARSEKTVFAFHFFDAPNTLKSRNDA